MPGLQEWIHAFEEGKGARIVKLIAVGLLLLALVALYDLRQFRNFTAPEAMDAAQLARNISEGRGYTTSFVRPFSMYLVEKHRSDGSALLKQGHPDLANPPLYPLLLAGLMKVAPIHFDINENVQFQRYQPELIIALFNQGLFLLAVLLVYSLAKRLFDPFVAWFAAGILIGTELFWRFSMSGQSSMLLVVIFLAVVSCLVRLEQASRESTHRHAWFLTLAAVVGLLMALGALTRYSFGFLMIPVIAFLGLFFGPRRKSLILITCLAFGALFAPWLARNYRLCGAPFGTAGYALCQDTTTQLSEGSLERSLKPNMALIRDLEPIDYLKKLASNSSAIVQGEIPKLGGNWLSAFFFVGLLVPFKNQALSRLRIFLLCCLVCMIAAQALTRTYLSSVSPELSSENLLVILAPLVFIFGAAMYRLLLDQINLPYPELRRVVTGIVGLVLCAPLAIAFVPPRANPISYPPYYPWLLQQTTQMLKPNELMMSDMPWAVSWYGRRQCIWLVPKGKSEFLDINDYQKTINALLITPITLNKHLWTELIQPKAFDVDWGMFILKIIVADDIPKADKWPLRFLWADTVRAGYFFVADWERWKTKLQ
jgi:4-amino-4-deoxy-L-arabinose transferase-like glycosyltransferase